MTRSPTRSRGPFRGPLRGQSAAVALAAAWLAAAAAAGGQAPETAEEVYSNIRVFRGEPAASILPTMDLIAYSLGVTCDHCHAPGDFAADDEPAKATAREMVRLMRRIGESGLTGERSVTCWTCHRGSVTPAAGPAIGPVTSLPTPLSGVDADDVLDRHLEAIGGPERARAVTSRVARGTAVLFGDRELPVEVRQTATLHDATLLELPTGVLATRLEGERGTIETPGRPPRPMTGAEVAVQILANDFHWAARPGEVLSELRAVGGRTLGSRPAVVVEARVAGHPVELTFGRDDGLLRRVEAWEETPVGRLPIRIDIGEYREVDGLRTPVTWTVARPQGSYEIRLDEIDQETGASP